ncbi:hypothetical protein BB427_03165 [Pseudoalteromonas sp. BMB]|uniref:polymorphic toxin-type HINT domain-containing protein n=1 Tax=Pseudoalteromonas sp. BMB TaxID=1874619 RepID=UPI00083DEA20|nr:polymorphic toxin-type HINT domain-containing protein [Pseudoalteromonas sp. BMB]ODB35615.1 hypothetical protein BB427_03165 [Pseudoalteromonas sp. BMB]
MLRKNHSFSLLLLITVIFLGSYTSQADANPLARKIAKEVVGKCAKGKCAKKKGSIRNKPTNSSTKNNKSKQNKASKSTSSKSNSSKSTSQKSSSQINANLRSQKLKNSRSLNRWHKEGQGNNTKPQAHATRPKTASSSKISQVDKQFVSRAKPKKANAVKQVARKVRRDKCRKLSSSKCNKLIDEELNKQSLLKDSPPPRHVSKAKNNDKSNHVAMIGKTKAPKKRSCCFVAGTQVLTATGYKNIEDVQLGEKLWAKNTDTGEQDWKPVTRVFVEPDRGIYDIRLESESDFEQKIEATDDHPFYVIGSGWKQTIELNIGDLIETDGHGPMQVVSVVDTSRLELTYNFTVADFQTYYVTEKNVLVHNCPFKKRTGAGKNEAHGDGGRAAIKAEQQLADLKMQLKTANKRDAKRIKQKIKNIQKDIERKRKGENHSMKKKG